MVDINDRNRDDNDTGYAEETGDTIASALDPFGSSAGPIAGKPLDNKAVEDNVDDNKKIKG